MADNDLQRVVAQMDQLAAWRDALLGRLFDRQRAVYDSEAKRIALHPGRRGGKSELLIVLALVYVLSAGRGESVILGAETAQKAKALFWGGIESQAIGLGLPLKSDSQAGTWTTPWGSWIQFWGVKDATRVHLLRGLKPAAALFDEVATYNHLLPLLVDSVLEQALADTGGPLVLSGTPSPSRVGTWFEICSGQRRGWSVGHWTVRENPCFPRDPEEVLRETLERIGGDDPEMDPAYLREWMGQFVNDIGQLVFRWTPEVLCERPADFDPNEWVTSLAVDFGMTDDCAWTATGARPHDRTAYTLESYKCPDLLPEQASERTARYVEQYKPDILVGDAGGLGKPYVEHWNRRFAEQIGIAMIPAEKADKLGQIKFMNGELGSGWLKVCRDFCTPLEIEASSLPWADGRLKEDPRYPNHCCDAWIYSHRHLYHYMHSAPESRADPRDPKRANEWAAEQDRLESAQAEQDAMLPDWDQFG